MTRNKPKTKPAHRHAAAERHLANCHKEFAPLIAKVGPCRLRPRRDHFHILVRTIVSQQLSTKAANSILLRLMQSLGPTKIRPEAISQLSEAALRGCGLSGGKVRSLRDLSRRLLDGSLVLAGMRQLADEEIRERLLEVHGIGPWSVDMFLMFCLGRPDVLPVGDIGFRAGVRDLFGFSEMPSKDEIEELAQPWRPYRSIAAWYCWRVRDS